MEQLTVKPITADDIEQLRKIHEKHYSQEFDFPDFTTGFYGAFVITNGKGEIVTGGGVKPIAETILVTNKDFGIKERNEALLNVLNVSEFLCRKFGHEQLHVFIQNEKYRNLLMKRVGFKPTKGQALVLNF